MKVCLGCGHRFNSLVWVCPACAYTPNLSHDFLTFAPDYATVSEGFESKFFQELIELEANNFWFRSRNRLIIWALSYYFPKAHNCLEIGCGTGFVLSGIEKAFPNLDLYGSEIFTSGLDLAAQRLPRSKLFQMDAQAIPFDDEFDVIGAFDVLEHIKEDTSVLVQMYQATRSGGGIILTVPQHPWLWSQADNYGHHMRRYRTQDLKNKLRQAGFRVVRTTSFVSLLLPLLMLSRLKQRCYPSSYDPTSELRISGWMNVMLERVLDIERFAIQLGVCFPMGGSLLIIAEKI